MSSTPGAFWARVMRLRAFRPPWRQLPEGRWERSLQVFNMKPLQIVFPSRADPESPLVDLDLHLPLLCFRPEKVLQVRSCPRPGVSVPTGLRFLPPAGVRHFARGPLGAARPRAAGGPGALGERPESRRLPASQAARGASAPRS